MDIDIRAVLKSSLIDWPGKICATVFTTKCNFRCGFCHNPELVFETAKEKPIPPADIIKFLESKKDWLDGICITGGEPTLHPGLAEFCKAVKDAGLGVKLDTNGTMPAILEKLINEKLVDYIAMDIKSSPEKYSKVAGVKVNKDAIKKSVKLIMDSGIDYEFRTTAVPGYFDEKDAEKVGKWLKGAKRYSLQQFNNQHKMLDEEFSEIEPYLTGKLERFRAIILKYIPECEIRNA